MTDRTDGDASPKRVAIVADNGLFARAAVLRLRVRGAFVRVICRTETAADRALALGADEAIATEGHRADDLRGAFADMDALLYDPGLDTAGCDAEYQAVIEAARAAALAHLLFVSALRPLTPGLELCAARARFEALLAGSGLAYSVLQPALYMQYVLHLVPDVARESALNWPWKVAQPFAMVDVLDVAEVAARVLFDARLQGGTFELCSGDAVAATTLAAMLGTLLGCEVVAQRPGPFRPSGAGALAAWAGRQPADGRSVLDLNGYAGGSAHVLASLLDRRPTSLEVFLSEALAPYAAGAEAETLTSDTLMDAMFASWDSSQL